MPDLYKRIGDSVPKFTPGATLDTGLFKQLRGNRAVNRLHVNRLVESIRARNLTKYLPIMVTDDMEIIDGRHRFEALKILKYPIPYVKVGSLTLKDVQVFNSLSLNWKPSDYLQSYCDMEAEEYVKLRKFMLETRLSLALCRKLLVHSTTLSDGGNSVYDSRNDQFKAGEFKITNYDYARAFADFLNEIGKFYEGYARRPFAAAMYKAYRMEGFEPGKFLEKLEEQRTHLVHCVNTKQYLILIGDIYNFKSREPLNIR